MSVIGITGGSGSGKSTLAQAVWKAIGAKRCALLSQDSYYRDLSPLPVEERSATNFDAPDAVDLPHLARDLIALSAGAAILPPVYDMTTHTRRGAAPPVGPSEHVVVEGLLLAADAAVVDALDELVFVDLPDDLRLARRIARDVAERGRTEAEVRRRWEEHARPMYEAWVAPGRAKARLVVRGDAPLAESVRRVVDLVR